MAGRSQLTRSQPFSKEKGKNNFVPAPRPVMQSVSLRCAHALSVPVYRPKHVFVG